MDKKTIYVSYRQQRMCSKAMIAQKVNRRIKLGAAVIPRALISATFLLAACGGSLEVREPEADSDTALTDPAPTEPAEEPDLSALAKLPPPDGTFTNAPLNPGDPSENALGALMGNEVGDSHGVHVPAPADQAAGQCVIHPEGGLRILPPIVEGEHQPEVIHKVTEAYRTQLEGCYAKELKRNPVFGGKLAIKLLIAADGNVNLSKVASSGLENPAMENCAAQAMRRWKFPPTEGGGIVIATISFELKAHCS